MKHSVVFKVINCDDNEVTFSYKDMEEFIKEWNREDDMPNIPMLDDRLIHAEVEGVTFSGETVLDAMNAIAYYFGWLEEWI